jgi:ribonuclease BN (tRNA processing enzyme)
MKLLMLGSTGYHPNDRRHTACFMLPQLGVVLDAGTGFFRVRDHLQTDTLDVFLSHAHLDHIFGLTFLFDVLYQKTMQRVSVHGEASKLAAIQTHLLATELFPVPLPCDYRPLAAPVVLADGSRLRYFPLEHPGGSVGFRIDWPHRSLAYVTDTTARADSAYIEQIRGVDTLIHECYFPDGYEALADKTGHSCASPVARLAKAAEVKRLVLVHVNPLSLEDDPIGLVGVKKIFPDVVIGVDGMELEV